MKIQHVKKLSQLFSDKGDKHVSLECRSAVDGTGASATAEHTQTLKQTFILILALIYKISGNLGVSPDS